MGTSTKAGLALQRMDEKSDSSVISPVAMKQIETQGFETRCEPSAVTQVDT